MPTALACYDDLLHQVYDSALDLARWPATLAAIAKALDARRVALWTFMHGVDSGGICFTYNMEQRVLEAWAQISATEDPFVKAAVSRDFVIDGNAFESSALLSSGELLASRLYRDLWAPEDIAHACFGIVFAGIDGRQLPTGISLYRSSRDQPFDTSEVDTLRRLLAHLARSLGTMFHLRDRDHQIAASRAALNRLGAGVMLLDRHGDVQFANAAAEALLCRGDTVRRGHAQPSSSAPAGLVSASRSAEVRAAFARVVNASIRPYLESDDGDHFAEALVLHDAAGRPAVVMHAAPLGVSPGFAEIATSACAIVFFNELKGRAGVAPGRLCQIFGLTPAEARAAMQLLESGSMQEMADRLGVSLNTFKAQLKAAYAKTRTNRQAGLLRLMLSLAVS